MKKLTITIMLVIALICLTAKNVKADEGEILEIRCTCYCEHGITASGHYTRNGIIAGKKDYIGKTAALYKIDDNGELGEFIGYFEFLDTGAGIDTDGDGIGDSIKNGKSIDVYRDSLEDAKTWISQYGDYVYIKIIDSAG